MRILGHGNGYIQLFLQDILKAQPGEFSCILPWNVALQNFDIRGLEPEKHQNKITTDQLEVFLHEVRKYLDLRRFQNFIYNDSKYSLF
jgi:hypothetical protein